MPRLGKPIKIGKSVIISLYSCEHDELMRQMAKRLPHAELVPYMVAAREKDALYRKWCATWDDPIL